MPFHTDRRLRASPTACLLAGVLLAMSATGCDRSGPAGGPGPPRVSFDSAEANELLGADDGFQLAIFYGAELMGSINGCGCYGSPEQGSVAWRFGYTEGFRARYGEAGILQVDAGHSLDAVQDRAGKLLPDFRAKGDWVVRAFDRLGLDAANITHHDIQYLEPQLAAGERARLMAETPMLGRYVSANLEPTGPALVAPLPYVVREIAGDRLSSGSLRIAIAGVTEDGPALRRSGFRAIDPATALDRALPRARAESDLVILLAYMDPKEVAALAGKLSSPPDLYIVAHPLARNLPPSLEAAPRIAYARYKTEMLGELRVHLDGRAIARARNQFVKLDEPLPRDPLAAQIAADADAAIRRARLERFRGPGAAGEAQR